MLDPGELHLNNMLLNRFGCSSQWFYALNNCDALFAAFPEAQKCRNNIRGIDLPAYRNFSGKSSIGPQSGFVYFSGQETAVATRDGCSDSMSSSVEIVHVTLFLVLRLGRCQVKLW